PVPSRVLLLPPPALYSPLFSLHAALPISPTLHGSAGSAVGHAPASSSRIHPRIRWAGQRTKERKLAAPWSAIGASTLPPRQRSRDRKSTRLNSSHVKISYAVFCLKKKIEN